jgi:hypothetical protein
MDAPFGRVAVGVAGACIMAYCLVQLLSAIRGKLSKRIRTRSIPPSLLAISRFGLGARAIIFGIIGMSLVKAALFYNPSRARGTAGAMRTLASQPYGGLLLALCGLGLAAYGIYAFVNAKYRQIAAS